MSNVIKQNDADSYASPLVFDFSDVERRAASLVAEAELKASALISASESQAVALKSAAAEKGREEGHAAGRDTGKEEGLRLGREEAFAEYSDSLGKLASSLQTALADFAELRNDLFRQAEKDLLDLSVLIAGKIVAREVVADAHVTVENLKRALAVLSNRTDLAVRVAPDALDLVKESLPELEKTVGRLNGVRLLADPELTPGGCVVTTASGVLDASIETQLAEVERILFGNPDE